jgi:hypothetical protein
VLAPPALLCFHPDVPNPRPKTYTERVVVWMTPRHREAFRAYARRNDVAIGEVLRDAMLEKIGRTDLRIEQDYRATFPGQLDAPHQKKPAGGKRHGATALVNLTKLQKRAADRYAKKHNLALSALIRDAGLEKIGEAPAKRAARGRAPGSRNAAA